MTQPHRTPRGYEPIELERLPELARYAAEQLVASSRRMDETGKIQSELLVGNWHLLMAILDTIGEMLFLTDPADIQALAADATAAEQRDLEEIRRINEYEMWGPDGRPGG